MSDPSRIDDWLDQWEELRDNGQVVPLDQFVARHCQGADPKLVARFRKQARALESMDPVLQEAGMTGSDAVRESSGTPEGRAVLQAGYEPVAGYRLERRLGEGGFGEVWRATAPGGFPVALKFVWLERGKGVRELHSLEMMKEIRHPHLLAVVGAWPQADRLVIATELADRTLMDRLKEAQGQGQGGIPRDELLGYMVEAAKALDFLHQPQRWSGGKEIKGIQHLDIKPENLLLSGNSIKVGDFGLVQCLEHSVTTHKTGYTLRYAAPEIFDGKASSQSDQYSLAVTYCELRGGRLPFDGTVAQLAKLHAAGKPDLSMLPPEERPAVARALAKNPKDRWRSCGAFVEALRQVQPGSIPKPAAGSALPEPPTILAHPDAAPPRDTAEKERTRMWHKAGLVAGVGALLVAVVTGLVFWNTFGKTDRPPSDGVAPDGVTLAVLDFENHSKDPALEGYRLGLRDMLVTDLTQVSKVKIVERSRLDAVLEEHKLTQGGFIDPRTAAQVGKGLGARSLLLGSYVVAGDDIRVDVRLVSVETGEIELADKVVGTKAEFFRLQQALAKKVLAGLQIRVTEQESQALARPQTKDFEAFRLYSEALEAQRQGKQEEAEADLRQAVARDPNFRLARQELAAVEAAALTRLADAEKEQLARAGQVGKALQEHMARQQAVVRRGQRDAAHFAALIVLSADAGLLGDPERERKLLLLYWKEFAAHVPPEKALAVSGDVQQLLTREGKFFQEQVDSGDYSTLIEDFYTPEQLYLKRELRGTLRWPKYTVIWPFNLEAREAFRAVKEGVAAPAFFEKHLPHYPSDYLRKALDKVDGRLGDAGYADAVRAQQSVVGYCVRVKGKPAEWAERLAPIQQDYLRQLDRHGPDAWDKDFVLEAVTALEALAISDADGDVKQEANRLLVLYARQAKQQLGDKKEPGGVPEPAPAAVPIDFFTLKLAGPRVVFLCDVGSLDELVRLGQVEQELARAVRQLSPATRFNFRLFGAVARGSSLPLFEEGRLADAQARREALAYVEKIKERIDFLNDNPKGVDLGTALEAVLADWPAGEAGKGDVCIFCYQDNPKVAAQVLERLKKREAGCPRIHFVGKKPVPALGDIVRASGGSGVLLEEGELLQIRSKPWNLRK